MSFHLSHSLSLPYLCLRRLGLYQQLWHQWAPEPGGKVVRCTDPGTERASVSSGCGWNEKCRCHKVWCYAREALCAAGWENCVQGEISLYFLSIYMILLAPCNPLVYAIVWLCNRYTASSFGIAWKGAVRETYTTPILGEKPGSLAVSEREGLWLIYSYSLHKWPTLVCLCVSINKSYSMPPCWVSLCTSDNSGWNWNSPASLSFNLSFLLHCLRHFPIIPCPRNKRQRGHAGADKNMSCSESVSHVCLWSPFNAILRRCTQTHQADQSVVAVSITVTCSCMLGELLCRIQDYAIPTLKKSHFTWYSNVLYLLEGTNHLGKRLINQIPI